MATRYVAGSRRHAPVLPLAALMALVALAIAAAGLPSSARAGDPPGDAAGAGTARTPPDPAAAGTPGSAPAGPAGEGAAPAGDAPPGPLRAYVGVHLLAVRHLDAGAGTFEADLWLWLRWRGETDLDLAGLAFANGTPETRELVERTTSGRWRRLLWRVSGTFTGSFPLADFPFDRQTLRLAVEHPAADPSRLTLEPDLEGTGTAPGFDIPGWIFDRDFGAHTQVVPLGPPALDAASAERSRVTFTVYLHRPVVSLLVKILVPLLVVLAMCHGAFFIDPADASTRIALATTAVFVCVCVHFTLTSTLPETNDVTVADGYFLVVYGVLLLELLLVLAAHRLHLAGRAAALARLDALARLLVPPLAVACALGVSWQAAARRAVRIDAAPATAPTLPSARAELVIGVVKSPKVIGPLAEAVIEEFLTRLVLAPLVELDASGKPRAVLAAEVPSFAGGGLRRRDDGSGAVRFRLRKGARWGDGSPVSVNDYVASGDGASFPLARAVRVEGEEIVMEVEGLAPRVIHDNVLFPASRLQGLDPEARRRIFSGHLPPLSGPFILERFDPDREVRFVRNPHHVPLAALERITVRIYPGAEALLEALARGEAHMTGLGELDPAPATLAASRNPDLRALFVDAPYVMHLDINHERKPLDRKDVRRALLHAIDREGIIRDVLQGNGKVAHTWLPPGHLGADAPIPRTPFDPGLAARMLDAAGCSAGPDGKRRGPDGAPLRFTISRGDRHPKGVVDAIARTWGALGIDVIDDPIDYGRYMNETTTRLTWKDFAFWGYDVAPYETGSEYWTEAAIPTEANGWRGMNGSRWRDPRMTELFARIDRTFVPEDLEDLLERQQRIWVEEAPVFTLYSSQQALVVSQALRGIRPHVAGGRLLAWNAHEWRFAE